MSWFLHTGEWPDLLVLHSCDNPSCVRFDHLFLGTYQDNVDDMDRKGRRVVGFTPSPGESNGSAKLTEPEVLEILARCASGETSTAIALDYPVTMQMINLIRHGKKWAYLARRFGKET